MNSQEKALSRILFQNKVYKANGQAFEDLFTQIMTYYDSRFRKIEAWGNIGDRKNDGYIEGKGIYYQVYAPKDIQKSYRKLVNKIESDFNGLMDNWENVQEFYFVINDKFKGVNADSEQIIKGLKTKHSLKKSGFFTADNLESVLLGLEDDQIQTIVGYCNPEVIRNIHYSILHEVVDYIIHMPLEQKPGEVKFPDWNEKIQFNKLSDYPKHLLNNGSQQLGTLNTYLFQNTTLADELQKQLTGLYDAIKTDWHEYNITGDNVFWELVNRCSPKSERMYQESVITIMAKYFESCDIFEEPNNN